MHWAVLLISAVFEAVWATALGMSDGLSKPLPTIVFLIALTVSMMGIGWAVKVIPIGTGYAVWVGIGAALTVAYAMATGAESVEPLKVIFIFGIILCVLGLKLTQGAEEEAPAATGSDAATTSPDEQ